MVKDSLNSFISSTSRPRTNDYLGVVSIIDQWRSATSARHLQHMPTALVKIIICFDAQNTNHLSDVATCVCNIAVKGLLEGP